MKPASASKTVREVTHIQNKSNNKSDQHKRSDQESAEKLPLKSGVKYEVEDPEMINEG